MAFAPSIDVRPATLNDLAFVARDGQEPMDRVAQLIAEGRVYIAMYDAQPVGYARVESLCSTVPYLALIWVEEQHRRHGVSCALLAAIERDARDAGHEFLYSSSQADEPAPQAWHRRMGFAECGFIAGINRGAIGELFFRKPLDG